MDFLDHVAAEHGESRSGATGNARAQAEHVRSIDVRRLVHPVGHLPVPLVRAVDAALRLHLDLD